MDKIFSEIETIVSYDIGSRGIGELVCFGDLKNALYEISDAHNIAIITGFYVEKSSAGETDGPPGAISLCKGLCLLGKNPSIITDDLNFGLLKSGLETLDNNGVALLKFPLGDQREGASIMFDEHKFDHLIFIERAGPSKDGHYYNANAVKMTSYTAQTDLLVGEAERRQVSTTGIGDGGNEIGMGKVYDKVKDHVRFGDIIGCTIRTQNLLSCGTSNWGAWALLAGLSLLHKQDLLPSNEYERALLEKIVAAGAVDAVTRKNELSVDGFPLACHLEILDKLKMLSRLPVQRRVAS